MSGSRDKIPVVQPPSQASKRTPAKPPGDASGNRRRAERSSVSDQDAEGVAARSADQSTRAQRKRSVRAFEKYCCVFPIPRGWFWRSFLRLRSHGTRGRRVGAVLPRDEDGDDDDDGPVNIGSVDDDVLRPDVGPDDDGLDGPDVGGLVGPDVVGLVGPDVNVVGQAGADVNVVGLAGPDVVGLVGPDVNVVGQAGADVNVVGQAGQQRRPRQLGPRQGNCYILVFTWDRVNRQFKLHGCWPAERNENENVVDSINFRTKKKREKEEAEKVKKGLSDDYDGFDFNPTEELRARMLAIWEERRWKWEWDGHGVFSGLSCPVYLQKTLEAAERILPTINNTMASLNLVENAMVETAHVEESLRQALGGRKPLFQIDSNPNRRNYHRIRDLYVLHDLEFEPIAHPGVQVQPFFHY